MTPVEFLGLCALMAGFFFLIVKDKKMDGMMVFYVLNGLVLLALGVQLLYYFVVWLTR